MIQLYCQTEKIIYKTKQYSVQYAGTVKRHNVCKRLISIDTGFKQIKHNIFLHVISVQ